MVLAGTRVLITYEGQPPTSYGCNEKGHHYHDCPRRCQTVSQRVAKSQPSWVDIVTSGPVHQQPETPRETVPHVQSWHEISKQDAPNPSLLLHDAPSASNTDEDILMGIQPIVGENPDCSRTNTDNEEAANLPSGNQTFEGRNTMKMANAPLQGRPTMDTD
jgi:hypothetical protein